LSARSGAPDPRPYHDLEYGYPSSDERVLFERLMLEINQAGFHG
jgi:DNA-3-methyladenine glycosylase I